MGIKMGGTICDGCSIIVQFDRNKTRTLATYQAFNENDLEWHYPIEVLGKKRKLIYCSKECLDKNYTARKKKENVGANC